MFNKKKVDIWINCPECDIKLKQKHLSAHMKRVHNKKIDDKEIISSESSNKKSQQNKIPWVISKKITSLIIIMVVILAFSTFLYFTNNDNNPNGQNDIIKSYFVSIEGKGNFSSIQEAVDSASENDIIFVSNGTYFENIKINKSIELIGENRNTTIIDSNDSGVAINVIADHVKISGFTIKNGGPASSNQSNAGIILRSKNSIITDCNISFNKNYGIYLYANPETSNNMIISNMFYNNNYGIYTQNAKANNISSNTFTGNTLYGIYLISISNDNLISDNIFTDNYDYAIRIRGSEFNTIVKNQIMNNKYGLYFCCGAENNIAYNNVFINNTEWNANDPLENTWDNGKVGNYWDDYNGTDANGDGIGDTPYTKKLRKADNFPLMKPI